MIKSLEEYQTTHDYEERLQQILLNLRRTHTESQFASMSKGFLKELVKAQREIALYLATPATNEQKEEAA